jgi:hypothetical protein
VSDAMPFSASAPRLRLNTHHPPLYSIANMQVCRREKAPEQDEASSGLPRPCPRDGGRVENVVDVVENALVSLGAGRYATLFEKRLPSSLKNSARSMAFRRVNCMGWRPMTAYER